MQQSEIPGQRLIVFTLLLISTFAVHAAEPVSKNFLTSIALGGHDSVAYHKPGNDDVHKASKGSKTWSADWKGATWLFTSRSDRDLFVANPDQYAPAYNGFCANALSLGEGLFKTDGSHWQIFEGRLYSFYAARGRDRWLVGDYQDYISVADKAWKAMIKQ